MHADLSNLFLFILRQAQRIFGLYEILLTRLIVFVQKSLAQPPG